MCNSGPTLIHLHLIITATVKLADGFESTFEITAIDYPWLKGIMSWPATDMYVTVFMMSFNLGVLTEQIPISVTLCEASEEF